MADDRTMAKLLRATTEGYEDAIFFLPSKTTNLRNEITRFQQRFDESFNEAWDRFNDLFRACPHHGFSELHQPNTFYNALNVNDQDSLNSAAGGNFLDKMPRECLKIIESKSKVHQTRAKAVVPKVSTSSSTQSISSDVVELKDMVRALLLDKKNQSLALASTSTPTPVKAVNQPLAYQALAYQAPIPQPQSVSKTDFESYVKANDAVLRNMQDQGQKVQHQLANLMDMLSKFMSSNTALSSGSGTLPDLRVPLILGRCFLKTGRALIDVHNGELTLRIENEAITYNLDQTLRYSANYNQMTTNKIDVICEEYSQEVLSFYDATTTDAFLGLADDTNSPEFDPSYYDLEGDILLLEAILNSEPLPPFPNHDKYLPSFKKELKVCEAKTVKSFVDEPPEMLERLARNEYYCFLYGFSGYFQIPIDPREQEKTTFTYFYKTFAYRRMPFGLCNAPGTFQRCMLAIFYDMVENTMEVFMDDFSVFGNSFENCLSPLDKMLQRCEDTNLSLNWEKSQFMVKEGIVLGHKISKNKIEVDKAKVDVIAKLPHPTTVKGCQGEIARWVLLLQKFDFKVLDTKGADNIAADHLSRLENPYENVHNPKEINETFLLETLNMLTFHGDSSALWFANFANYRAGNFIVKGENRVSWLDKLDDALWAFRITYKTPIGCTPYQLVYGKACHLPIELEHKAYWALKQANFDLTVVGDHQKVQLNELNELRDHAYENSLIYIDSKIKNCVFNVGDRVLLFNSRLKIFLGKLKTRWSGPFTIAKVFPYGTVELSQANGPNFKVNGHHVKHYFGGDPQLVVLDLQTFPMN
uniref:Reverse transcriptase domain-containing protein n=1 Tax=Tanacetum cinerariifolium TaxID=118510 RepID=A0A699GJ69_TANCI|nr:reverse transcriptase domain-containing protein [Tanacetum cinerariifolium]